jgi:hypothetical protein
MSLVAAAVCPHPPLLVPAVGAGEPVAARRFALDATRWLLSAGLDLLTVVGDAPVTGSVPPGATGSFAGFGVPARVTLGTPADGTAPSGPLPLSLSVGAWLLAELQGDGDASGAFGVDGFGVRADVTAAAAAAHGARLASRADRVGLLVMGDGSARRSAAAPGGHDGRAAGFDAAASAALAAGDPAAVLALDPALARDLLAAGRAPWQVLAGAARRHDVTEASWIGYVLYDDAPYGVGYLVATWKKGL